MRFTQKRKYNLSFIIFLILFIISVAFYFIGPSFIDREPIFFTQILIISIIDIILVITFVLGLYRVNYYLYHNHIEIRRSLHKTIYLPYTQIEKIVEYTNDPTFLWLDKSPTYVVYCTPKNNKKHYKIRVKNHQLFKLVVENEQKISIQSNKK